MGKQISKLFSYKNIKSRVLQLQSQSTTEGSTTTYPSYIVTVSMRAESYGTTNTETEAVISDHARDILRKGEFVQFFTACGPTYVRSAHHAQEVTAIFQFKARNDQEAQSFAEKLRLYVRGNTRIIEENPSEIDSNGFNIKLDFDGTIIKNSLTIEIAAHGLGLNKDGTETLVSANLSEFNDVMKFAFKSMAKNSELDDDDNTHDQKGLLYGIEVVPWTDNGIFLDIVQLSRIKIRTDTPLGLIANSVSRSDGQVCSSRMHTTDHFGKCCKPHEIVDVASVDAFGQPSQKRRCQPQSFVSTTIMRDNLQTNAEFVAWISDVVSAKTKSLSDLGQCVNILRAYPDRFDYYYLQASNDANYDGAIEKTFTVKELKMALDPAADLEIIQMVADENDEYLEMFYQPCLSALYGGRQGTTGNTDPKNFMAKPWYDIEECVKPSCLEPSMAWDRVNGEGCVKGLLGRDNSLSPIPHHDDEHCAKTVHTTSGKDVCKFGYTYDANLIMQMDNCRQVLPQGRDGRGRSIELSMHYLMEYFCMPQIALHLGSADGAKMDEVDSEMEVCVSVNYNDQDPSRSLSMHMIL